MYDRGSPYGAIPFGLNPHHPVNQGLRGWWTTKKPYVAGGSTWWDETGVYPGTLTSMSAGNGWQPGDDRWPGTVKFDGSTGYVALPIAVAATRNYTVAMWIRTTSTAINTIFYSEGNSGTTAPFLQFSLNQTDATTLFAYQRDDALNATAGGSGLAGTVVVNDGKWHHVVLISTSSTMAFYVDGNFDASASQSGVGASTLNEATIGCLRRTSASNFWAGQVADVRTYPFAFDSFPVADLYQESLAGYPEALLYWRPSPRIFAGAAGQFRLFSFVDEEESPSLILV